MKVIAHKDSGGCWRCTIRMDPLGYVGRRRRTKADALLDAHGALERLASRTLKAANKAALPKMRRDYDAFMRARGIVPTKACPHGVREADCYACRDAAKKRRET